MSASEALGSRSRSAIRYRRGRSGRAFPTARLGFHPIGLPALYPPGDFKITLLGGSLEQAQSRRRMQNRFFKITDEEVASMKDAIAAALERMSSTGSKIAV
jgi:hypothetical protein